MGPNASRWPRSRGLWPSAWLLLVGMFLATAATVVALPTDVHEPLCVAVLDPLAAQLSCPCVKGYAQRDYRALASWLEAETGKKVTIGFGSSLSAAMKQAGSDRFDLAIGKFSVLAADAAALGMGAEPLCALANKQGSTDVCGLFVVAADDAAETVEDLFEYTFLVGPPEHVEKHELAVAALRVAGFPEPFDTVVCATCSDAAATLLDAPSDPPHVAVLSDYAEPLLEGCGTVPAGAVRVVGKTEPSPFIVACVPSSMDHALRDTLRRALLALSDQPEVCATLESKGGFVDWDLIGRDWPGWRGPRRDGFVPGLPTRLPDTATVVWRRTLARSGLGGVAAVGRHVVIGDRNDADTHDIFRCFDTETGETIWEHEYEARAALDYGNSPRATPLIENGRVHLLGAMGHLHCVTVESGDLLWKRHLVDDYRVPEAALSAWGYCSSPLIAAGRLVVNPGAPEASLVALNPATGADVWRSPGRPAGYASFIAVHPAAGRQIVGYDRESLGGWDLVTGARLWSLAPRSVDDFRVPTPVALVGKADPVRVAVSSETAGTAIVVIGDDGTATWDEGCHSDELACEMCTPVNVAGWLCGVRDRFVAIDCRGDAADIYEDEDDSFATYAAVVSGSANVLTVGNDARLTLHRLEQGVWSRSGQMNILDEPPVAAPLYAHPAFVGNRVFIRTDHELLCIVLAPPEAASAGAED